MIEYVTDMARVVQSDGGGDTQMKHKCGVIGLAGGAYGSFGVNKPQFSLCIGDLPFVLAIQILDNFFAVGNKLFVLLV